MELDLNELERRAKAATPGKWTWKQIGSFNTPGCAVFWPDTSKGGVHYRRLDSGGGMIEADANFIAAANPAVVLELVRRLREAEARGAEMEAYRAEKRAVGYIAEDSLRDLLARDPGGPPIFAVPSDRNHIPLYIDVQPPKGRDGNG